jgi:hypothetical protein
MTAEAALKLVETDDVETKALSIVDQAKAVKVTDSQTYLSAGVFWKQIGEMISEVKDTFDPICDAAHRAHKAATTKRAKYLEPLETAYKSVKRLMSDYDAEQERIRKAEEARLQAIAQKEEEERCLQEAILAEQSGNKEEAEAIIETPVQAAPVVVPKSVPKMAGGPVYRTIWKFRIKNAALIPKEYLIPDDIKIGGVVRAMKSATSIPGIEAYEERV